MAPGTIKTVAGNGNIGLSGNIYISDPNNNRVRKVDTMGNISTFAGNGLPSMEATAVRRPAQVSATSGNRYG